MPQGSQAGRVLLVEDDGLVAMLVEDMLDELGFAFAGNPGSVTEGMVAVSRGDFDVAVLDLNLNGERVYPVADALVAAGIPFVFATGYGASEVPEAYRRWPVAAKSFRLDDLETALKTALALSAGT